MYLGGALRNYNLGHRAINWSDEYATMIVRNSKTTFASAIATSHQPKYHIWCNWYFSDVPMHSVS